MRWSCHVAVVGGGALAMDGGSGKNPLQNSFLVTETENNEIPGLW